MISFIPIIAGLLFSLPVTVAPVTAAEPVVREGLRIEFSLTNPDGAATARQGDLAEFRLRITDEASGRPVRGLRPAAWLDAQGAKQRANQGTNQVAASSCRERVASYLKGSVGMRPLVDFNSYHLLVMNQDASISVIDPVVSMTGRTSLLTSIPLKGPGADWVKSRDGARLFIAVPRSSEIAVVDTASFKLLGSVALPAPPTRLALQPDGRFVWAGHAGAAGTPAGVVAVDTQSLSVSASVPTGDGHHEFAFAGDGPLMLVTNRAGRSVSVVDTAAGAVAHTHRLGGEPLAAAHSALSGRFYVSTSAPAIEVIDARRGVAQDPITVAQGAGPAGVSPDGRWLLVLNTERGLAHVFDTATGKHAWDAAVGKRPYQLLFTDGYAHVRSLDTNAVHMLNLAELGRAPSPVVNQYEAGASAPGLARDLPIAPGIARASTDNAVFVASPADAAVYFYMEGMNAPSGSFQGYGHSPRAVEVVSRAIRETAPGTYTATARVPASGPVSVAMMLDAPRLVECFEAQVAANAAIAGNLPAQVDFLDTARTGAPGTTHPVRFRITRGGRPVEDQRPEVVFFRSPGTDRASLRARATAPGEYQADVPLGGTGAWLVHVMLPPEPGRPRPPSYISILAR